MRCCYYYISIHSADKNDPNETMGKKEKCKELLYIENNSILNFTYNINVSNRIAFIDLLIDLNKNFKNLSKTKEKCRI